MSSSCTLDLLKVLGFHFQAKGAALKDPYVVYPHWNKDELLIPAYDALRAVLGKGTFDLLNLNFNNFDFSYVLLPYLFKQDRDFESNIFVNLSLR